MSVLDSSLADKPLQLSKTVRRWRGLTSAAPFHAGPLHFNSSALSRADSSMPDGRRISPVSIQSWDQPNSRSSGGGFSTGAPGRWGNVGSCQMPRTEARIPVPPTRTAANPRVLLAADVGALPVSYQKGSSSPSPFPSTTTRAPAAHHLDLATTLLWRRRMILLGRDWLPAARVPRLGELSRFLAD